MFLNPSHFFLKKIICTQDCSCPHQWFKIDMGQSMRTQVSLALWSTQLFVSFYILSRYKSLWVRFQFIQFGRGSSKFNGVHKLLLTSIRFSLILRNTFISRHMFTMQKIFIYLPRANKTLKRYFICSYFSLQKFQKYTSKVPVLPSYE